MSAIDELAVDLAGIFEHAGWVWGLGLAGIPERVPDAHEIAEKIEELLAKDAAIVRPPASFPTQRLVSDARIVLAFGNAPPYNEHVRVLLDIGELPLPSERHVIVAARHGETTGVTEPELMLADDPDLANVFADMDAWQLAHPCDCEALCECDAPRSGS